MKIVGGPYDGKEVALEPGRMDYCLHELRLDSVTDFLCSERGRVPEMVETKTIRYTVRMISGPGGFVDYLAPEDWSDIQAIRHQFSK